MQEEVDGRALHRLEDVDFKIFKCANKERLRDALDKQCDKIAKGKYSSCLLSPNYYDDLKQSFMKHDVVVINL